MSLSLLSGGVVQNGPERSRARRCWARRSETLTARTVLRRSLKRERRERKLGEKWAAILVPLPAASNIEINANLLHRWRKEFRHGPGNAFPGVGKRRWDEAKVAQLERKVGQQTLEIDFLKGCLQRIEEQRMLQALTGKPRLTSTSASKSRKAPR